MKKFLLLVLLYCSFCVSAQTDSTKRSINSDTLKNTAADSLRLQPQDTLPKNVSDSTLKRVEDSTKPLPPDTGKATIPADTTLYRPKENPVAPKDSVKPAEQKADSLKITPTNTASTTFAPKDTIRPLPPQVFKDSALFRTIRFSPDSIKYSLLDSLSYDQLQEYYQWEPAPSTLSKGSTKGDSLYYVLNPLTIPTTTVGAEERYREEEEFEPVATDSTVIEQQLRPKVSIGVGRLGYHGDLYRNKFQSNMIGRPAVDLAISQRLTRYLQLDFSALMGKVGANERVPMRNENIQTEIRAGGVNLLYDFGNLIPDRYVVRPFVSFGAFGFEFLSKTDLRDKNGSLYFYWQDGTIRDKAEGSADAQNAKELVRDYTYESDVRELNRDNLGKYTEAAFAFPIGAGVVMKINDRIDVKLNYQYFLSTTDNIDGISHRSVGNRKGNRANDNFSYASVSVQYDLTAKKPTRRKPLYNDTIDYNDAYLMALFNKDSDKDSIIDINDACQGTPEGVTVDAKGCPLDGDNDGVPDFRDDELATAAGLGVNLKGVGQTDAYWQAWYDQYMNDSISGEKTTEYTGNIYAVGKKKDLKKDPYTVELVRYNGSIPSDELAFLLSIGDINSTTLEDGTTVVYTSGNYEKLGAAIKRRDEFREEGNKKAGVSMFKGRDVVQLPEDELESLLKNEIEDLLKLSIGDSGTAIASNPDEAFNRNEIVYRVQLGAFRNKISTSVFGASTGVLELKTGENVYRYVTKGYPTIEEAAAVRADLVVQGYSDAFVTAYRGGRRIPMSQTKATVDKNYQEDLNEDKTFNSIDKSLLSFKIQLGPLKKKGQEAAMDEKVKDLKDAQKQVTSSGSLRYTSGNFPGLELAEEYRKTLEEKGFTDAFIIATFKGEIISMQEAMELLK